VFSVKESTHIKEKFDAKYCESNKYLS